MKTTNSTARIDAAPWRWLAIALSVLTLGAAIATLRPAAAQDPDAAAVGVLTPDELSGVVGPIALYPDDLVAIVLPASTYPLQIVQAARFLEDRKNNPNLKPNEEWDDSVVALLNYPEVVTLLNDDLDWTYDLGTAVLNQREDVLDAIQGFRDRAYAAGNLRNDGRQTVTRADNTITIKPADPQVIYVPYYEPERVVIYQPVPVYHYYPYRYPVYYYPYPASYVFDTGFFWGVRSWFSIGWHTHFLHVYDWGYYSHPYFGWNYYDPWYVRNVYINVNVNHDYTWEPRHRYGGRPVVHGYEGRVYTAREEPRGSRGVAGSGYRSNSTEGAVTRAPGSDATRTNRGAAGSAYRNRGTEGQVRTTAPAASGSERQPVNRGAAGSAYRNRSVETTARQDGQGNRAPGAASPSPRPTVTQPREPVYRGGSSEGTYRGRGTPQSLERGAVSQPQSASRATAPPSRMPREDSRGSAVYRSEPRAAAPPRSEPSYGGGNSAPRGDSSGGGYRGGGGGGSGDSSGGNYRSGGERGGGGDRGGGS